MSVGDFTYTNKVNRILSLIVILYVSTSSCLMAQDDALELEVTIRMTDVKRQTVLRSLSRQTGYTFTYDTRLIKPLTPVTVTAVDQPLKSVLDIIFEGENFGYSVIQNHIIIFKRVDENTPMIIEVGKAPVFQISGKVVEGATKKPLPYATVGIYRKGIGTISNSEGDFSLKITENAINDTLRISYLGFYDRTILVSQAINNQYIIELERDYVPIPEVIIRNRVPIDVIEGIHRNLSSNYGSSPTLMTAFYRESVSKKDKILIYSEAVLNIYKSAYTRTLKSDQINVFKSRKIENIDLSDTLLLKLRAGLDACLALDGIKNSFDFIDRNNYSEYNYRMTDIVNIGEDAAYVIEFKQKEELDDMALFQGAIYVNTDNYGLHTADFELNPEHINLLSNSFVSESSRNYTVKIKSGKYRVDYRYLNNRFYLNHVRGDLEFHARKKRKLFGSTYNIVFEMAVTGIDSTNVERFTKDQVAPTKGVFSETIDKYDYDFWGTDNYMLPELDIQEALMLLNVRMEKFKKEQ